MITYLVSAMQINHSFAFFHSLHLDKICPANINNNFEIIINFPIHFQNYTIFENIKDRIIISVFLFITKKTSMVISSWGTIREWGKVF